MKNLLLIFNLIILTLCHNLQIEPRAACTSGETNIEDCGHCFCVNNQWNCAKKICNRPNLTCEEGLSFTDDNDCFCQLGKWNCKNEEVTNPKPMCVERETYVNEEQRCYCVNNEWYCEPNPTTTKPACVAGETYSNEQQRCYCINNEWNCEPNPTTTKPAPLCVPGTEFKYGCNWCFCSSAGTPTYCTSMPC